MKKIAFVIPYFGKFPGDGFDIWLWSCRYNPTVDWLIYTDDKTEYNYPDNVKVHYCTLKEIKERAQKCFDFEISLERPRKLCDYKPAYGEIFANDLEGYDYWGYCDIDLVWGDIRKFLTDEVLESFERIGYQGHCLLYKNIPEVTMRYKTVCEGIVNYKKVYTDPGEFCFDENGMDDIYNFLGIPYFKETIFAHLEKYEYGFFVKYLPEEDEFKNRNQVFTWKNGKLFRNYITKDGNIASDEFMYIHFFCRPIKFKQGQCKGDNIYVMYADAVEVLKQDLTVKYIKRHTNSNPIHYYITSVWYNRKKLTPKRVWANIKRMIKRKTESRK